MEGNRSDQVSVARDLAPRAEQVRARSVSSHAGVHAPAIATCVLGIGARDPGQRDQ